MSILIGAVEVFQQGRVDRNSSDAQANLGHARTKRKASETGAPIRARRAILVRSRRSKTVTPKP